MKLKENLKITRIGIGVITLMVLMMGLACAEVQTLPDIQVINRCLSLPQSCSNCTYNNITSIRSPNGTEVIYNPQLAMTKLGTHYNYTYCGINDLGKYIVNGYGDLNGANKVWVYDFFYGQNTTAAQSVIYAIIFFLFISLFIFLIYSFKNTEFSNGRDGDGIIRTINWKKHLKIAQFLGIYFCFIALTYFAWNLSFGVLKFTEMANLFQILFRTSFIGLIAILPLSFVFFLVTFFQDKKIYEMINRGLTVK